MTRLGISPNYSVQMILGVNPDRVYASSTRCTTTPIAIINRWRLCAIEPVVGLPSCSKTGLMLAPVRWASVSFLITLHRDGNVRTLHAGNVCRRLWKAWDGQSCSDSTKRLEGKIVLCYGRINNSCIVVEITIESKRSVSPGQSLKTVGTYAVSNLVSRRWISPRSAVML